MDKLSDTLKRNGFLMVLGTEQMTGGIKSMVEKGQPMTCILPLINRSPPSINGVCCVYDEDGKPWIIRRCNITDDAMSALQSFPLTFWCSVPHGNDGGHFVHDLMPALLAKQNA